MSALEIVSLYELNNNKKNNVFSVVVCLLWKEKKNIERKIEKKEHSNRKKQRNRQKYNIYKQIMHLPICCSRRGPCPPHKLSGEMKRRRPWSLRIAAMMFFSFVEPCVKKPDLKCDIMGV